MNEATRIPRKWRPPLALIVVSVLLMVMALPTAIIVWAGRVDIARGFTPNEILALSASLLLTLVIAYVLTRTITKPINALIERTNAISRSGQSAIQPIDAYGTHEIAVLSQSFLDLAAKMIERTEYIRSFAAHVSHELKSPLTAIHGAAELMRDEQAAMTPLERQRFLDNILADTRRLDLLLQRLRELARAELPTSAGETMLAALASELGPRFPTLRLVATPAEAVLPLQHEAAMIVLVHLVENAVQQGATEVRLTLSHSGSAAMLDVADNGSGISAGNREQIFDPFFSTRREVGGTGMGLGIARAALWAQRSDIALLPGETGATFRITMPLV
jgi:two-component system OmpR family sensor kinase